MLLSLFLSALLVSMVSAAGIADLQGTWSTKSRKVITGPVRWSLDRRVKTLALTHVPRTSTIRKRMSFSNPNCLASPTRLRPTGTMKRRTTAPFPIVSSPQTCLFTCRFNIYPSSSHQSLLSKRHHAVAAWHLYREQQWLTQLDAVRHGRSPALVGSLPV